MKVNTLLLTTSVVGGVLAVPFARQENVSLSKRFLNAIPAVASLVGGVGNMLSGKKKDETPKKPPADISVCQVGAWESCTLCCTSLGSVAVYECNKQCQISSPDSHVARAQEVKNAEIESLVAAAQPLPTPPVAAPNASPPQPPPAAGAEAPPAAAPEDGSPASDASLGSSPGAQPQAPEGSPSTAPGLTGTAPDAAGANVDSAQGGSYDPSSQSAGVGLAPYANQANELPTSPVSGSESTGTGSSGSSNLQASSPQAQYVADYQAVAPPLQYSRKSQAVVEEPESVPQSNPNSANPQSPSQMTDDELIAVLLDRLNAKNSSPDVQTNLQDVQQDPLDEAPDGEQPDPSGQTPPTPVAPFKITPNPAPDPAAVEAAAQAASSASAAEAAAAAVAAASSASAASVASVASASSVAAVASASAAAQASLASASAAQAAASASLAALQQAAVAGAAAVKKEADDIAVCEARYKEKDKQKQDRKRCERCCRNYVTYTPENMAKGKEYAHGLCYKKCNGWTEA